MISPEIFRRYPIFGVFNDQQLRTLAMITDEKSVSSGTTIFEESSPANEIYFLVEGGIDLFTVVRDPLHPDAIREFPAGEVNPGELFGVSSFIKPYKYTTSARATINSQVLVIDTVSLRNTIKDEPELGFLFLHQVAQQLLERLNSLRIQISPV